MSGERVIKLSNVSKIYRTADVETTALRNVEFELRVGEFVALMGPSGCGKSTFLNIVGTLDKPTAGEYWFEDQNITCWSEHDLLEKRKTSIGFVFQNFNLIDELSVFDNVELALLYHRNVPVRERKKRVHEALERMNISHRARHTPLQLSGGQQQRVAIARAVVARPTIILADEPTGNLDSATGEEVMLLLKGLNITGTAVIMVTHSPAHAEYAHRVVTMLDGAISSGGIGSLQHR
jgi:putative ABC transport system ATP-binding protein